MVNSSGIGVGFRGAAFRCTDDDSEKAQKPVVRFWGSSVIATSVRLMASEDSLR